MIIEPIRYVNGEPQMPYPAVIDKALRGATRESAPTIERGQMHAAAIIAEDEVDRKRRARRLLAYLKANGAQIFYFEPVDRSDRVDVAYMVA